MRGSYWIHIVNRAESNTTTTELGGSVLEAQKPSRLKRVSRGLGRVLFATSVGIAGGGALATAIPTKVPFGHSEAKATLSYDGMATIEAGAVGSLRTDIEGASSIGPLDVGATFVLGEIAAPPRNNPEPEPMYGIRRSTDEPASLENILEDFDTSKIQYYGEFYRAISRDQPEIQNRLRNHTLKLMALVGLATEVGVLAWSRIETEQRRRLLKDPRLVASIIGVGVLGASVAPEERTHQWRSAQYIFEDTELRGVEISGAPAEDLSHIASEVIEYLEVTDAFYDKVKESAMQELANKWHIGDEYGGDSKVRLVLLFSDLHCNPGMPQVMTTIAKQFGIKTAIDTGDTTMSGTVYENLCVSNMMDAFTDAGITIVHSPGNHDSDITEDQMRSAGAHVLDGTTIRTGGLSVLGVRDPYASRAGKDTVYTSPESIEEIAEQLRKVSCDSEDPLVLAVHNNELAKAAMEESCFIWGTYGHTHNPIIQTVEDAEGEMRPLINSGTAGGAAENMVTMGPLNGDRDATFSIVALGPDGTLLASQLFSADQHAGFHIGRLTRFDKD